MSTLNIVPMPLSAVGRKWTTIAVRKPVCAVTDGWQYLLAGIDPHGQVIEARHAGKIVTAQAKRGGETVLLAMRAA